MKWKDGKERKRKEKDKGKGKDQKSEMGNELATQGHRLAAESWNARGYVPSIGALAL